VIGAAYVAAEAGIWNLITLDVGGTSADIAIVDGGRPRYSTSVRRLPSPPVPPVSRRPVTIESPYAMRARGFVQLVLSVMPPHDG
jgi:hypothetical protein